MTCPRCEEHPTHPGEELCHVCGHEVEGIYYEGLARPAARRMLPLGARFEVA